MQFQNAKHSKGFSLIELLVVIAIVGIISAIAVPQYKQYIVRSNRAAAQTFMMTVASRQQQYLLDARAYAPTLAVLGLSPPPPEVAKNYRIAMTVPGGAMPAFLITATPLPRGPQVGDGILSLNDQGNKAPPNKWK